MTSGKKPPNIVYVLVDDMGYGDVSCLNPEGKIKTPNIDRLAREGMVFADAHSSSAVCSPSRYSVLTGRYNWRSTLQKGIVGLYGNPLIDENRLTVPALLRQQGYHTACIGKWHLGQGWPFKPDAESFYGIALPANAGEDSVSMLPLLQGKEGHARNHIVHHSGDGKFAVRDDRWKLLLCPGSGGWTYKDVDAARAGLPLVQLYDMREGPCEKRNKQSEYPGKVRELLAVLKKDVASGRSTPGMRQDNDVPVDIWKRDTMPGVDASIFDDY